MVRPADISMPSQAIRNPAQFGPSLSKASMVKHNSQVKIEGERAQEGKEALVVAAVVAVVTWRSRTPAIAAVALKAVAPAAASPPNSPIALAVAAIATMECLTIRATTAANSSKAIEVAQSCPEKVQPHTRT